MSSPRLLLKTIKDMAENISAKTGGLTFLSAPPHTHEHTGNDRHIENIQEGAIIGMGGDMFAGWGDKCPALFVNIQETEVWLKNCPAVDVFLSEAPPSSRMAPWRSKAAASHCFWSFVCRFVPRQRSQEEFPKVGSSQCRYCGNIHHDGSVVQTTVGVSLLCW